MQFTVTFSVDNAAFHNPLGNSSDEPYLRGEVADVLRRLRTAVTMSRSPIHERDESDPFVLLDSNGARIGIARFEEE